jgi:hypothetical protein
VYKISVGRPEEKVPLGRPRHKWENNIKIYHRKIGLVGVDWFHPAQDRNQWQTLVNMVMNLRVP